MFGRSIFLVVAVALGGFLFWLATRDSLKKADDLDLATGGKMVDLPKGTYLYSISPEHRLAISVEEEGRFSIRLYDESNKYSNHIRFAGTESFVSITQTKDDSKVVIVDKNLDGLPDFRVIESNGHTSEATKEKLAVVVDR
jgi:hypothetical protein